MLTTEDVLKLSHKVTQAGHWYLNLEKNRLYWSDEVYRIHGYEPGSFQPEVASALDFYHPEDRERVSNIFDQTLTKLVPLNFVSRIVRQDGTSLVVHSQGEIKYREDGRPGHLFGVFRDITEEWTRQQHSRRLARSMEQSGEATVMTDQGGFITWANRAFTQITGYSAEQFLGRKPGELLQGPDTDPAIIKFMSSKVANLESFTTEVLNYHRDGHSYWLRVSCQPDFDANGKLLASPPYRTT